MFQQLRLATKTITNGTIHPSAAKLNQSPPRTAIVTPAFSCTYPHVCIHFHVSESSVFSFHERSCCLRLGGPPQAPTPPSGKSCPHSGWSWDDSNSCCIPHTPRPKPVAPSCDNSSLWSESSLCCQSKSSHGFFQKREGRSRL